MLFVVAAALIDTDNRILLCERPTGKPMAGLWEFPGGKVNIREETPEQALKRELKEELGIQTSAGCFTPVSFVTHPLGDSGQPDQPLNDLAGCDPLKADPLMLPEDTLLLLLYACRRWHGIPHPQENQTMRWVKISEMRDVPMPPADIPLLSALRDAL
jgi:8-oxo-dGTP diphosphatase